MSEEAYEGHPKGIGGTASVLDDVLESIPSVLGKLVWVASLRLASSDEYRCLNLERIVSPEFASAVLRDLHKCLFQRWLALDLQGQSKDFAEYLEALGATDLQKLALETGESLIPPDARQAERYLFETDFAVTLELARG